MNDGSVFLKVLLFEIQGNDYPFFFIWNALIQSVYVLLAGYFIKKYRI